MSTDEIEQLLGGVRRGEHAAFQSLHAQLAEPMKRFAWQMLRNREDAIEAVQSAFVKLIENRRRVRRNLRSYCFSIVGNLARTKLKRRHLQMSWESANGAEFAPTRNPVDSAMASQAWGCLLELPVEEREPLLLHFDQGLTVREVAVALQCPKGTAATRIRRGLNRLREKLATETRFANLSVGALPLLLNSHSPDVPSMSSEHSWTNLETLIMTTTASKTGLSAGALLGLLLLLGLAIGFSVVVFADSTQPAVRVADDPLTPPIDVVPDAANGEALSLEPAGVEESPVVEDGPPPTSLETVVETPVPATDIRDLLGDWKTWKTRAVGSMEGGEETVVAFAARVVDQHGNPVDNCKICFRDPNSVAPGTYLVNLNDSRGIIGQQLVKDRDLDKATLIEVWTFKDGMPSQIQSILIPPGVREFEPEPFTFVQMVASSEVSGTVTNELGTPLVGMHMVVVVAPDDAQFLEVMGAREDDGESMSDEERILDEVTAINDYRFGMEPSRGRENTREYSRIAFTDSRGQYRVAGLPAGKVRVSVDTWSLPEGIDITDAPTTEVRIKDGDNYVLAPLVIKGDLVQISVALDSASKPGERLYPSEMYFILEDGTKRQVGAIWHEVEGQYYTCILRAELHESANSGYFSVSFTASNHERTQVVGPFPPDVTELRLGVLAASKD